jgi:hypothetical protein
MATCDAFKTLNEGTLHVHHPHALKLKRRSGPIIPTDRSYFARGYGKYKRHWRSTMMIYMRGIRSLHARRDTHGFCQPLD